MNQPTYLVPLGFTDEQFPPGTHICQIYSDDDERDQSINQYIRSGLEAGEHIACFSDSLDLQQLADYLDTHGISLNEAKSSGDLTLAGTHEVYFENNKFDPDRMLGLLRDFDTKTKTAGCPGCRVIGEMTPEIDNVEGGNRLLEYESKVSLLLKDYPVTAVCQYNARHFDGATIMDVLRVHPLMVVRGSVMRNPYFIPPEEFLKQQGN